VAWAFRHKRLPERQPKPERSPVLAGSEAPPSGPKRSHSDARASPLDASTPNTKLWAHADAIGVITQTL
jgi:hypothetical protein